MMKNDLLSEQEKSQLLRFLVVESSLGARVLYRLHLLELQQFVDIAWDENLP